MQEGHTEDPQRGRGKGEGKRSALKELRERLFSFCGEDVPPSQGPGDRSSYGRGETSFCFSRRSVNNEEALPLVMERGGREAISILFF